MAIAIPQVKLNNSINNAIILKSEIANSFINKQMKEIR